MKIVMHI